MGGRASKAREMEYLEAVKAAATTGEVTEAIQFLLRHKSWRARHAGLTLVLQHILGKPPTMRLNVSTKMDDLLALLRGDSDNVIDGEVNE